MIIDTGRNSAWIVSPMLWPLTAPVLRSSASKLPRSAGLEVEIDLKDGAHIEGQIDVVEDGFLVLLISDRYGRAKKEPDLLNQFVTISYRDIERVVIP